MIVDNTNTAEKQKVRGNVGAKPSDLVSYKHRSRPPCGGVD